MARINGSVTNNTSQYGCYLEVTEGKINIETNKSPVTVKLHITRKNYGWQTSNSYSGSIKIDGTSYSFSYSPNWAYASSGDVVVATATKDVPHNDDGRKTCSVSATWNTSGTYSCGTASASGSIALTQIPRASGIACSSPYIGDTATITIDRKASSFTNTVTYKIGELTGVVAEKTSETVVSLVTSELADEIYDLIPDSKQVQGTIYCETYSGDTKIGDTTSANFNLYAKEDDCKPDITATIVDTNESTIAITGGSKLIKYISEPKVTIAATPKYSAEIKSYSINLNDGQTSTLQEDTFESIGSDNITINAIDSRGYGNPQTITLEMIDYTRLHIDIIDISRTEDVSSEVILNASGVWFNGSFSDANINNLTASFQYKSSEETSWTDGGTLTPTIDGNKFTFTDVNLGNIYDYQNEYQFKIILSDLLMIVGSENKEAITLPKGQEVVAIGDDTVWVYGDLLINDVNIIDLLYPIGRGFIDFTNTDYSNYLGLTWERELIGMTPVGLNADDEDFNEIGKTGGEKTHTLTVDELPPTTLETGFGSAQTKDGALQTNITSGWSRAVGMWGSGGTTVYTKGGNQPHNNMQPYQVVAYWKRIA